MHEHLVVLSNGVPMAFPFLYDRSALVEHCVRALTKAKAQGVQTLVDVSTVSHGRDIKLISEVAERSEVNVVVATGIYLDVPWYFQARGSDEAADVFVRELEVGVGDTAIRAGIIKVASDETVTPHQEIILRGAARASIATGAPITTHTHAQFRTGLRQLEILREEGVDPERVIIGHSITFDLDYLAQLYSSGSYVGWDLYFWPERLPVEKRDSATELLHKLIMEGRASQTVLSHDGCAFSDSEGQLHDDWGYIPRVVLPMLRRLGTPEDAIDEMMVAGPGRLLDWA
jgi:phosphotriesterase-related protein